MWMLIATLSGPVAGQPDPSPEIIRALADRLLACHHEPTGVLFIDTLDKRAGGLVPYFAHFQAYGLLRAYEAVGDARYLNVADAWIDWYRAHMRPDGTVTDYTFNADDTLTPTDDMDSTDSYAAMYLWLVAERFRVTGEPVEWLRERERGCVLALSAILLTMQPDGLTIAKPTYAIEYTMDNAEVVVGFRSAALLFDALGNPGLASHARSLADATEDELRTLYSAERGYFAWYRDMNGDMGFALEKWYPDVMAQVLPLMRIGRPEAIDQSVFAKTAADHPLPEFDLAAAQAHIWYGLAAQRVGNEEASAQFLAPLHKLTPAAIAAMSPMDCASALEALTGGSRP